MPRQKRVPGLNLYNKGRIPVISSIAEGESAPCPYSPNCPSGPYSSIQALKKHVRDKHYINLIDHRRNLVTESVAYPGLVSSHFK